MMVHRVYETVREYGQWRTGDGGFSVNTWSGEAPGLYAFADHMALCGAEYVHQVNDSLVSDWWKVIRETMGTATAPTRLHQLRSFLAWCQRKGYLEDDPTAFIRAPRLAPEPRERLTAAEILSIIESAPYPQHRVILALCGNLGLRSSELQSLTIRDLNLDTLTLLVHVHKTRETPPDPMPLTHELAQELTRWIEHYRDHPHKTGPITPNSRLVPAQHYHPQTGRITYRPDRSIGDPEDVVKTALLGLSWPVVKGEGIHTLRRSIARIYFDAVTEDDDPRFDEALLGTMSLLHHARPETTLRYIGVDRQTQARDKYMRGTPLLTSRADRVIDRHLRAVQ